MRLQADAEKLPSRRRLDRPGLEFLCNGEGNRAFSTLYETAVYFHRALRIRLELPFIELRRGDDYSLLELISAVRTAFHGKHGIWATLQDSMGSYVSLPDRVMNFREFCQELIDNDIWFTGLVDFYVAIEPKLEYEVADVVAALDKLISFLRQKTRLQENETG